MSILIKGMEMPNACCHCPCSDSAGCAVTGRIMTTEEMAGMLENIGDCPAHPLPEKHGRLIDADAYISMMEEKCDYEKALDPYVLSVCRGGIKLMPTIVEAEGEEEGET